MQDDNASKTHVICQCEWDTGKMSMRVVKILDGNPSGHMQDIYHCQLTEVYTIVIYYMFYDTPVIPIEYV